MEVHPTAKLIKQLNIKNYKHITFKETDLEDQKHIRYQIYDKYVENYDKSKVPYFIGYTFLIYKNEFDMQKERAENIFIIKLKAERMHKFPNTQKIKLKAFDKSQGVNLYEANFLYSNNLEKQDIFDMYCSGDFYKI